MMSFKEELRAIRVRFCMTQKVFAEHLGVPLPTYKSWELGKSLPSFEYWNQIMPIFQTKYLHKRIRECYDYEKGRKRNEC